MSTLKIEKKSQISNDVLPKRRPLIGIAGHLSSTGNFAGATLAYIEYFEHFGDVTIILPTSKTIQTNLDLLVIVGGPDISPSRYLSKKSKISWKNQKPDPLREYFDENILPQYIDAKIPIFGICRGHQSIAALFGAKLEQNLTYHDTTNPDKRWEVAHRVCGYVTDYDVSTKKVVFETNSEGKMFWKNFGTNSLHHQAVMVPPSNAKVLLWTDEEYPKKEICFPFDPENPYHKIEGLLYTDFPIATVQHHPEEVKDAFSAELINNLIQCSPNKF